MKLRQLLSFLLLASPLFAQPSAKTAQAQLQETFTAHQGDFDYLLGDWEFTGENPRGKFRGHWSAVQVEKGRILDEYRVFDDAGQTVYLTNTIRALNAFTGEWELIGMESGNGLHDFGTGRREGGEVRIEQKFGVARGNPAILRIRYYNIQPDRFSWAADRSTDGGVTWVKDYQKIEARRAAPAHGRGVFDRLARPEVRL